MTKGVQVQVLLCAPKITITQAIEVSDVTGTALTQEAVESERAKVKYPKRNNSSSSVWQRRALRYGVAFVAVAAGFGLRAVVTAWIGPGLPTYITFYPAVMVAALLAGFGPGLLATALTGLSVAYWVLPPEGFLIASPVERLGVVLFAGMGLFMSAVAEFYRRDRRKAAAYDREMALRETRREKEFLADVLEHTSQPFAVGYPDGRLGLCNHAYEQLTGYRAEELRAIDWATILTPPEWREPERQKLEELHRSGQPVRYEKEYIRKDGTRVPVELLVHLVKDAGGKPEYYYSFLTDITARRRAQTALRESEDRLNFALETSHTGAWDLDLVDHTAFRSLEHDRVFGYAELLPKWTYEMFLEHVLPEDRAMVDGKFRQAMESKGDWNFECRIRRTDGQVRWIWGAGRHRLDAAGAARRMSGIVQDITERKLAEEALRESRTLLQTVIEGTSDAIYVKDPQGRYLLFNSAAARATGKRADEVLGQDDTFLFPPDQARVVMDGDRAVMAGGKIVTYEENVTGASGELVTYLSTKGPLFDGQGRMIGLFGVARDITERKLAEEALQESEERHQLATSVAKEAIWEVNLKTGTVRWNRAYVELFGRRMPRPTAPGGSAAFTRKTAIGWMLRSPGCWPRAATHGLATIA